MLSLTYRQGLLAAVMALPLAGCYLPVVDEAALRQMHERGRETEQSKAFLQAELAELSCYQLSEWAAAVAYQIERSEAAGAFSHYSVPVLRGDLPRIHAAFAARGCVPRAAMLNEGTATPTPGARITYRCACWEPYAYYPIAEPGGGPAGADCVTVRAELAPGSFVFVEQAPTAVERRHEFGPTSPVYGSLNQRLIVALLGGYSTNRASTNTETDGVIETTLGRLRILTDACAPLPPETANRVERTVVRWLTAAPR